MGQKIVDPKDLVIFVRGGGVLPTSDDIVVYDYDNLNDYVCPFCRTNNGQFWADRKPMDKYFPCVKCRISPSSTPKNIQNQIVKIMKWDLDDPGDWFAVTMLPDVITTVLQADQRNFGQITEYNLAPWVIMHREEDHLTFEFLRDCAVEFMAQIDDPEELFDNTEVDEIMGNFVDYLQTKGYYIPMMANMGGMMGLPVSEIERWTGNDTDTIKL